MGRHLERHGWGDEQRSFADVLLKHQAVGAEAVAHADPVLARLLVLPGRKKENVSGLVGALLALRRLRLPENSNGLGFQLVLRDLQETQPQGIKREARNITIDTGQR